MAHAGVGNPKLDLNWANAAQDYAAHRQGPPLSFYRRLGVMGIGAPNQRMLDLGTGTGVLALQFARQGCTVSGADVSEGMINAARASAGQEGLDVDFRVALAEQTPFDNASMDAITANHCWMYFDSAAVVAEAKRVLIPGGPIVVSFFSWLQIADPVVRATEALILRHNPKAPDFGWNGVVAPALPWAKELAVQHAMFWYDEPIPYTHAGWRGRVRANRNVGAMLTAAHVQQLDADMAALLADLAPDPFTVLHRVSAYVIVPK